MAHKSFYVTRTEDPVTHTAGAATLNRADQPQLIKVYDNPTDIDVSTLSEGEVVGTKGADFNSVAIVDRVVVDNMNPVTSNAVAKYINDQLELSEWEVITLPHTAQYDGFVNLYQNGVNASTQGQTSSITLQSAANAPIVGFAINSYGGSDPSGNILPVKKGDVIKVQNHAGNSSKFRACWYKNRDYTNRLLETPTRESETKKSGDDKSEEVKSEDEKPVESGDGGEIIQGR